MHAPAQPNVQPVQGTEPLRLFVTGGAGVGKSFFIDQRILMSLSMSSEACTVNGSNSFSHSVSSAMHNGICKHLSESYESDCLQAASRKQQAASSKQSIHVNNQQKKLLYVRPREAPKPPQTKSPGHPQTLPKVWG